MLDIYFTSDIIKCFLAEYTPVGDTKPVRNFKKIASNYIENGFCRDVVMWIPIFRIIRLIVDEHAELVLFVKCYRIVKGLKIFNVNVLMKKLRCFLLKNSEKKCMTNRVFGNDQYEDHNWIEVQVYL
jgi:hypothetical protein